MYWVTSSKIGHFIKCPGAHCLVRRESPWMFLLQPGVSSELSELNEMTVFTAWSKQAIRAPEMQSCQLYILVESEESKENVTLMTVFLFQGVELDWPQKIDNY